MKIKLNEFAVHYSISRSNTSENEPDDGWFFVKAKNVDEAIAEASVALGDMTTILSAFKWD